MELCSNMQWQWEILPGVHMDLTADPVKGKFSYEVGQPYVIPGSGKQFRTERLIIRPSFRNVLTCPRCNFLCKAWVIRGDVTIQRVNKPFTVQKTWQVRRHNFSSQLIHRITLKNQGIPQKPKFVCSEIQLLYDCRPFFFYFESLNSFVI